jgi:hypothetical protein
MWRIQGNRIPVYTWRKTITVRFLVSTLSLFIMSLQKCLISEHSEPGLERQKLIDTVNRDEVDDLDDPPTPVCYFIVGGNENGYFGLEPLRHEIMVSFITTSGKVGFEVCVVTDYELEHV